MRVISQEGAYDLNYDNINLEINQGGYICTYLSKSNSPVCIAKYSNVDKCIKAMKILRNEYKSYLRRDGGRLITTGEYIEPIFFIPPKVFQFPQDDEIEV